ncbi:hypothetical protein F4804DRAFT_63094 [Jackrogersella minutella]|nr:hypothetical protein F4804DRAFT_63094 [Jackrogersella minutella]
MASSSQTSTPRRPSNTGSKYDNEAPTMMELQDIAIQSCRTGTLFGGVGLLVGAGAGIMRAAPPTLFAVFAGFQWFSLASTFFASRSLLWHAWGGEESLNRSDRIMASGVAGGVSGMVGGMFRGPRNIIPGILFFSTLGATSTYLSQLRDNKPDTSGSKLKGWLEGTWSPLKPLSDEAYEAMLEEKLLRIDAEISILDDHIASLQASSNASAKPAKESSTTNKS